MKAFSVALTCCMAFFVMTACDGCFGCEHVWDEGTVTVQKTCTTDGSKVFKCKECGEEKTEVIPAGHDYTENVVEATCYAGGYTEKTCSGCGDTVRTNTTQEATCSYVKESVPATCTTDGYDQFTCKWCGDSYKNVTARAIGHQPDNEGWVEGELVQLDGCNYNHVETTTCTVCQETITYEEVVQKHNYVVSVIPATCTTAGQKVYTCRSCYATSEAETIAIDTNAHAWDDGVLNSETGITTYSCTNSGCAHTKQVVSFKTQVEATVPSTALQTTGQVELQNAEMKMDAETLAGLGDQDIKLKADTVGSEDKDSLIDKMDPAQAEKLGDGEIFNFTMTGEDDQAITSFGGKITVTVPYNLPDGEDPENIAIWYINDEGVPTEMQATYSVINGAGYATFETDHFSYYTVVRLTPAERCALYGHKMATKTVEATCGVQGYTVSECTRCHKIERSAFTPALAHDYETAVVNPSCSAMGYTTYTCKNCGDKYVSDYTAQTAHAYVDSVKAPTCTADGYTTHTCSNCGKSYTDTEVSATGHNYTNGNCSVCGRKDPNAQTNFYFNLIESIASAETYYLEISDVKMEQTMTYNNGDVESITYEMKLARAQLGFDDKGIVGKGEGTLVGSRKATGSEVVDESYFADVEFLFKDGYVYAYVSGTGLIFDGGARTTMIMSAPQETLMAQANDGEAIDFTPMIQMLETMAEKTEGIVNGITAVENSPFNSVIRAVVEYVYTKTETADGYSFELNENRLKDVYNILNEKTLAEIFDLVFGAESYTKVQNWLVASLDKKVSEVEAEAKTELARWGINLEAVYDLVDEVMGMMGGQEGGPSGGPEMMDATTEEPTGIRAMIAQMKDATVFELLASFVEGKTKDEVAKMITDTAKQFGDMKVMELAEMLEGMSGAMGGESDEKIEGYDEELEQVGGEANIEAMLDEIIALMNKVPMTFTTDKTGALIDYTISAKDVEPLVFGEMNSAYDMDIKESMTAKFVVNGTFAGEFDHIVKEASVLAGANNITEDFETEYTKFYVADDGKVYAWEDHTRKYSIGMPEEETKNGVDCFKVQYEIYYLYVLNESMKDVITATSDCHGWWNVSAQFDCYHEVKATVWYDKESRTVVASEVELDAEEKRYTEPIDFYYNPATGKYAGYTQHTFKFIKTIDNEGCSNDYEQYLCTVCGIEILVDNDEGGHDWDRRYVLKEGSTTCEDGAYEQEYCKTCGRIDYQYETRWHNYNYRDELVYTSPVCGPVYARLGECPCGQQSTISEYYNWKTDCRIGRTDDTERFELSGNVTSHYKETYGCPVEGCGFTFTLEHKEWYEYDATAEETCTYHTQDVYDFGEGKTYTRGHSYADHRTVSERADTVEGGYMETYTCLLCNQVTSIQTYDKYGRPIRYENKLQEDGWYRVFTGCDYVEYTLDGEEKYSSTDHAETYSYDGQDQCTQYTPYGMYCQACDWRENDLRAPDDWYYDGDHSYYHNGTTYVCRRCGTENETGVDGWIVLEDMLEDGVIKVGYFNKRGWLMENAEITVMANYDPTAEPGTTGVELQGDLFTKEITSPIGRREAGIVTVDMSALSSAVQEQCGDIEVETISVVFWVLDESQTQVDSEGNPVPFYLAYGLTFTVDEFGGFNG